MRVRFALVSEGTSEHGLKPHLEDLCVRFGASEAEGAVPNWGLSKHKKDVASRLQDLPRLLPGLDLIFVHRDADRAGVQARLEEIERSRPPGCPPIVPIIPVTMLEAWLLLDEDSLFAAVGRPTKRGRLSVPKPKHVERVRDPKERLKTLLAEASATSGRRLKRVNKEFPKNRAFLLERLDVEGPVRELSSWQALLSDLERVVTALCATSEAG